MKLGALQAKEKKERMKLESAHTLKIGRLQAVRHQASKEQSDAAQIQH